ncbi:zinc finger protein 792-like isoform 2-T5 [Glossophaga mutica]
MAMAPLRRPAEDMNFVDVAIAFSKEEWRLLDEAQRLMYCDVMLEIFALVASVGCCDLQECCCVQDRMTPPCSGSETPVPQCDAAELWSYAFSGLLLWRHPLIKVLL